jgi:class 3 adenylate cyclase/tetratricopeptide (TPR) repeat protein
MRGSASEAERRQLTIMFCDLVGSTPLSEKLDPEALREVVRAFQEQCATSVHRFAGTIALSLGDGLLIYFGLPVAHEDDAYRAVRTGLDIIATLPQLNRQLAVKLDVLRTSPLRVRIGIHTGLVVAGEKEEKGDRDLLEAVGETPVLAMRLQSLAGPNSVVISGATYQLVEGFFDCRVLGAQHPSGGAAPIVTYQVTGESEVRSRIEVAVARGLTPFVGRQELLSTLRACWQQAQDGHGRVVFLSGEAGIGKSRLLQALRVQIANDPHTWVECHCASYHDNSALYPAIDLLWRGLRFTRDEEPARRFDKLERGLAAYGLPLAEAVPVFATLLSLPTPAERYPPLSVSPQRQRQRLLELLRTWLLTAAERGPVVGVVEDLHWADPSTLEALSLFLDHISIHPILLVMTFRPEFQPPWPTVPLLTHLRLGRLQREEAEAMASHLMKDQALAQELVQQLVTKADGVPLFVEELTKTVLASIESLSLLASGESREPRDRTRLQTIPIPATLQDSLRERLDRLGPAKSVAQLGATIGREFSYEVMWTVFDGDEHALRETLGILVAAELLAQQDHPPHATYVFTHALIQEAAYQSLTKRSRQYYHQRIAHALSTTFPDIAERHPELVAHHWTEANDAARAVSYWYRAGCRAAERSAHTEASRLFGQAIALLHTLPETDERVQQELLMQISLGKSLIVTRGYGAPEVEPCYQRALTLCRVVGETPRQVQAVLGMAAFSFMRAELRTVHALGTQGLEVSNRQGNHGRQLHVHWTLGQAHFHQGEFTAAHDHLSLGLPLYARQQYRVHVLHDPGVMLLAYLSLTDLCLGYPDRAVQHCHEMLSLARSLRHRFSLAFALNVAATVRALCGMWEVAYALVDEGLALCEEQGFPVWLAYGQIMHGWMGVQRGDGDRALGELQRGIAAWEHTGARVMRPFLLALKGQACRKLGRTADGRLAVEEALAIVESSDEQFCTAELWRLQGEFVLRADAYRFTLEAAQRAEAYFQHALTIARQQHAKMLELRAAISFARLWQSQGKPADARRLLVEVYDWFTEGFETEPLQKARALIEQMSSAEK